MKKTNTILQLRSFLILWGSQAVSTLGSSMTSYALILWVYGEQGTATSIAMLSFFTYLPSILFCFIAGTLADKWDKKKIMLASDFVAALGTVFVLVMHTTGHLMIWHLYCVNFLISFMNAFQNPAGYVAVSLLAPKDQYIRVSGLYAFSNSLVTILTPAIATAVLAFGGLRTVLIVDLSTFAVGFLTLLLFIRIPKVQAIDEKKESFLSSCLVGLRFLKEHRALLEIILFFSFINLLAHMTGFGILPAMILKRTGDNQVILGMVSSSVGIGALVGSILVTAMKPAKNRARVVFLACAISFALESIPMGVGRAAWVWVPAAFTGNLPLPFLNANLTTIMRTKVPVELQGRVFSARDTVQFATIPLGLFLGGFIADHVAEPFMLAASPVQRALSALVGTGDGSGIALMFLITGVIGCTSSLLCLRNKQFYDLNA